MEDTTINTNFCKSCYDHTKCDFNQPSTNMNVAFLVEGTKKVFANKLILSLWSPVFSAMFEDDFAEKEAEIVALPGKDLENFQVFIRMLHPPHQIVNEVNDKNAMTIYALAREYQVDQVLEVCRKVLLSQTPSVQLLEDAEANLVDFLVNHCLENSQEVIRSFVSDKKLPLCNIPQAIQGLHVTAESKNILYSNLLQKLLTAVNRSAYIGDLITDRHFCQDMHQAGLEHIYSVSDEGFYRVFQILPGGAMVLDNPSPKNSSNDLGEYGDDW